MAWQGAIAGGTGTGAAGTGGLLFARVVLCGEGVGACVSGVTRCWGRGIWRLGMHTHHTWYHVSYLWYYGSTLLLLKVLQLILMPLSRPLNASRRDLCCPS